MTRRMWLVLSVVLCGLFAYLPPEPHQHMGLLIWGVAACLCFLFAVDKP